jgi:hypothetical protein
MKGASLGLGMMFAASVAAAAAPLDSDVCKRDLFQTDGALRATHDRLSRVANGSQAEKCAEWRRHVTVLRKASEVFGRCTTGHDRSENVGQMDGSVADFLAIIKQRCGGL